MIYLSAEACEEARKTLKEINWFKQDQQNNYGKVDKAFKQFSGDEKEISQKRTKKNTVQAVLSTPDFFIQWKADHRAVTVPTVVDPPVKQWWYCIKGSRENIFDQESRMFEVKKVLTDNALVALATMLFDTAVEFEYHRKQEVDVSE